MHTKNSTEKTTTVVEIHSKNAHQNLDVEIFMLASSHNETFMINV